MRMVMEHEYGADDQLIQEQIVELKKAGHAPSSDHAYDLAGEIYEKFRNRFFLTEEAKELLFILSQPDIRAVFDVHDRVANREYLPVLPDLLPQFDDEDTAVKIVKLVKNNEPLGVTIKKRDTDGVIYIARVFVGGPAERSGLILVGDEVHEVNGIPVKGRSIEQVVHILNTCDGTISLKLIPLPIHLDTPNSKVVMKTYFTYDPSTDLLIPCKDAGLAFKSGDILEILNTDDPIWWQARHYSDSSLRTGLIPSRALQTRRANEMYNNSVTRGVPSSPSVHRRLPSYSGSSSNITTATECGGRQLVSVLPQQSQLHIRAVGTGHLVHIPGSLLSPRLQRKLKKTKKVQPQAIIKEDYESQMLSTSPKMLYEEVRLYKAPPAHRRTIVLIGPMGVGKSDLKQKLLRENSECLCPLPVTSRPKKLLESDGKEYSFISKSEMDKHIQAQRLLEYGEYKGHLYGITLDSILDIIASGKTCLLTCLAQSLQTLKCAAIKPYVIFIKPPNMEKLKAMKIYTGEKSSKKLTVAEMEELIMDSAKIESLYGDMCDEVVINADFQQTYKSLVTICQRASTEEMWIPSAWLEN